LRNSSGLALLSRAPRAFCGLLIYLPRFGREGVGSVSELGRDDTTYEVWLSKDAVEDRERLTKEQDRKLLWWRDKLSQDPTVGDNIRKSLIPKRVQKKHGIENLWRLELPNAWRVLYTIASRPGIRPEVHIIRILSHKGYERLFGY